MSKDKLNSTIIAPALPSGVKDILPVEAKELKAIKKRLAKVYESYGYEEVFTPAFEYLDVLSLQAGERIKKEMFKFLDDRGEMLALRPDMTTSIARLVSQKKLSAENALLRLFYQANVFRQQKPLQGQPREFWQSGIELIGGNQKASDAEIIMLLVDSLKGLGLTNFKIGLGSVAFLKAFLDSLPEAADLKTNLSQKNLVAVEEILSASKSKAAKNLKETIKLRGWQALSEAAKLSPSKEATSALANLKEVAKLLKKQGYDKYLTFDFSLFPDFDYYTGLVFEAYVENFGVSVASGGRYDNLLSAFGLSRPAAGFAFSLERLHLATVRDKKAPAKNKPKLRVALSKGVLYPDSVRILKESGFDTYDLENPGRRLLINSADDITYILARPADVPTYVESGAVDLGFAGKDALMENGTDVFELLDLKIGACRFVLAETAASLKKAQKAYQQVGQMRVATKYPQIAGDYLNKRGLQAELITLRGSVELAPITGLADMIVDLTTTGKTLAENGLRVVDEIAACSARLIANTVSARLKYEEINGFAKKLKV